MLVVYKMVGSNIEIKKEKETWKIFFLNVTWILAFVS